MANRTFRHSLLSMFCFLISATITMAGDVEWKQDWKFRKCGEKAWLPASVPGTVHTDLFSNRFIPDPFFGSNEKQLQWIDTCDWEYEMVFSGQDTLFSHQEADLVFDGLDTYADVYLNDSLLLSADNMFRSWVVPLKKIIRAGENKLRVVFHSAVKKGKSLAAQSSVILPGEERAFTRKAAYHYGWDWGPRFVTCGIWRPVHIRTWDHFYISNIHIVQEKLLDNVAVLNIAADVYSRDGDGDFLLKMVNKTTGQRLGHNAQIKPGMNRIQFEYNLYGPKKWWCNGMGTPFLYTFYFEGSDYKGNFDRTEQKIGLRTLEIVQEADSAGKSFYVKLNGVLVFIKGANYVPMDNFLPRVSKGAQDSLLIDVVAAHMNMLRVWGGGIYESDQFYSMCDEKGILVWQDLMFAGEMLPGDSAFVSNVLEEVKENSRRLRNHPCLALWCGNNEIDEAWHNWGWQKEFHYSVSDSSKIWDDYQHLFLEKIPALLSEQDSGRFYWPSSPSIGWGHEESLRSGDSHYWGVWWGNEPIENYNAKVGRFASEYGMQALPAMETIKSFTNPDQRNLGSSEMKAHQKHPTGFETIHSYLLRDYKAPENLEDYIYISQLLQANALRTAIEAHRRSRNSCMGTMYWQLNDCWPVVSWSTRDYSGRWKAGHYAVQDAFKTVLVSPEEKNGKINFYVVSDSSSDISGRLLLQLISFDGKEKWFSSQDLVFKAGNSQLCYSFDTLLMNQKVDPEKGFILATVISKGVVLDERLVYLRKPKDLLLPKAKPEITVDPDGTSLVLKSSKLIKDICIRVNGSEQLSRNYFDVVPGEEYRIALPAGSGGKKQEIVTNSLNSIKYK